MLFSNTPCRRRGSGADVSTVGATASSEAANQKKIDYSLSIYDIYRYIDI